MSDDQMFRAEDPEEDHECPAAWVMEWLDDPIMEHTIEAVVDRLGCSRFEAVQLICTRSIDLALLAIVQKVAPSEK